MTAPRAETSGSDQRPARSLALAAMHVDIQNELGTLKQEPSWERGNRTLERSSIRVGSAWYSRRSSPARPYRHIRPRSVVTIHCIEGELRVHAGGREMRLPAGDVVVLARGEPHGVDALAESAFVLMVADLQRS